MTQCMPRDCAFGVIIGFWHAFAISEIGEK